MDGSAGSRFGDDVPPPRQRPSDCISNKLGQSPGVRAYLTQVGVRVGQRDVTVLSEPGPLYLEDTFPVARSAIRGQDFVLLDKNGNSLANVPLDKSARD